MIACVALCLEVGQKQCQKFGKQCSQPFPPNIRDYDLCYLALRYKHLHFYVLFMVLELPIRSAISAVNTNRAILKRTVSHIYLPKLSNCHLSQRREFRIPASRAQMFLSRIMCQWGVAENFVCLIQKKTFVLWDVSEPLASDDGTSQNHRNRIGIRWWTPSVQPDISLDVSPPSFDLAIHTHSKHSKQNIRKTAREVSRCVSNG